MDKEIINYPQINGITLVENNIPQVFPSHWHNAAEFVLVLKDGCRYKIGDTLYKSTAGDILLVWPRELHELVKIPHESIVFIQFSSHLIENNTDLASATRFLNECHLISSKKNAELTKKIRKIFEKISDIYKKKNLFSETKCKLLVYEILVLIGEYAMKEFRQSLGEEHFSSRSWNYIRAACSYIAEHSAENITQTEVAEKVGLSPFYFSKLFNEYTKMAFPSYLSSIRVQNAINLLADENRSITECAYESGFQSTTAFNKLFHELTGCNPRDYRKLHRHSSNHA